MIWISLNLSQTGRCTEDGVQVEVRALRIRGDAIWSNECTSDIHGLHE